MGGGGQDHRTADTEMGKQHLPKVLINLLPIFIYPQGYVPEAQALSLCAQRSCGAQGHQRTPGLHNFMARLLRQTVAVSGAACQRVTDSSGCHNHPRRRPVSPAGADAL